MDVEVSKDQHAGAASVPTPAEEVAPRQNLLRFYSAVVLIQGLHLGEHFIQLAQVHLFGVPDEDALGILGLIFSLQETEEWLHLGFNAAFLAALWYLVRPLLRGSMGRAPAWALGVFVVGAVGLETWHTFEHGVIIRDIIANGGCDPCFGIVDRNFDVTDTNLHFGYNLVAYIATCVPWLFVRRNRVKSEEAQASPPVAASSAVPVLDPEPVPAGAEDKVLVPVAGLPFPVLVSPGMEDAARQLAGAGGGGTSVLERDGDDDSQVDDGQSRPPGTPPAAPQ